MLAPQPSAAAESSIYSESDDETDLELLFKPRDRESEIFYFKRIDIHNHFEEDYTQIQFWFKFADEIEMASNFVVEGIVSVAEIPAVVSIGMCVLTWYWMGFATKRIVVEAFHLDDEMISFWQQLYNNVLLEFMYLNRQKDDVCIESPITVDQSGIHFKDRSLFPFSLPLSNLSIADLKGTKVLCPLGGVCSVLLLQLLH